MNNTTPKLYQEDFDNLRYEDKQEVKAVVDGLTNLVNHSGHDTNEYFVFLLTRATHRTLQQNAMGLLWQTIKGWAALPDNMTDARNEGTVKACREIVSKTESIALPYI